MPPLSTAWNVLPFAESDKKLDVRPRVGGAPTCFWERAATSRACSLDPLKGSRAVGLAVPALRVASSQLVMRATTLHLATEERRPGVSLAGIAFSASLPRW